MNPEKRKTYSLRFIEIPIRTVNANDKSVKCEANYPDDTMNDDSTEICAVLVGGRRS